MQITSNLTCVLLQSYCLLSHELLYDDFTSVNSKLHTYRTISQAKCHEQSSIQIKVFDRNIHFTVHCDPPMKTRITTEISGQPCCTWKRSAALDQMIEHQLLIQISLTDSLHFKQSEDMVGSSP